VVDGAIRVSRPDHSESLTLREARAALLLIPELSPKSQKRNDAVTLVRLPPDFENR